eukprot:1380794-Lingulodinium_polyedra.AAC.1
MHAFHALHASRAMLASRASRAWLASHESHASHALLNPLWLVAGPLLVAPCRLVASGLVPCRLLLGSARA